jgi:hypothetical protein
MLWARVGEAGVRAPETHHRCPLCRRCANGKARFEGSLVCNVSLETLDNCNLSNPSRVWLHVGVGIIDILVLMLII